jgi:hypothetical protein
VVWHPSEQGRTLREIATAMGVSHETSHKALDGGRSGMSDADVAIPSEPGGAGRTAVAVAR